MSYMTTSSVSSSSSSATAPGLSDVVPWSVHEPRTILVLDSLESDGRFVLYQHATQVLTTPASAAARREPQHQWHQRLMWLSGGPVTAKLIRQSLRKIGCTAAVAGAAQMSRKEVPPDNSTAKHSSRLTIRSLVSELSDAIRPPSGSDNNNCEEDSDAHSQFASFVKGVYRQLKSWVEENNTNNSCSADNAAAVSWILLDDMSTFASFVGERLAFALIQSLHALSTRTRQFGLMLRCSNDHDQRMWKDAVGGDVKDSSSTSSSIPLWLGAGGWQDTGDRFRDFIPWERSVVEIADYVVDVCPLFSGGSREIHGRLVFTKNPAAVAVANNNISNKVKADKSVGTANSEKSSSLLLNYYLADNKVVTIRMRR